MLGSKVKAWLNSSWKSSEKWPGSMQLKERLAFHLNFLPAAVMRTRLNNLSIIPSCIPIQVLINLLQGPQSEQAKLAGCQMSGDTRNSTMSSLRSERKQLRSASAQYLKSQREQHLRILQEGLPLQATTSCSSVQFLIQLLHCFRCWNLSLHAWGRAGSTGM